MRRQPRTKASTVSCAAVARAGLSRAAVVLAGLALAGAAVAGCGLALPPKTKPHPTLAANPAAIRLADAPALLVQCAIRTAGLRPGSQSWLTGLSLHITGTNASDFLDWFRGHDTPGPYPQTFVIDGHRTHYLAFGAAWVRRGSLWVPAYTARTSPQARRTSLYAWSVWAAAQDKLPVLVCGTSVTARDLQAQIYGAAGNPW
jgi:hypothetical protein